MKNVIMFTMTSCPYCQQAVKWMQELQVENPMYRQLNLRLIDEEREPETASQYDYFYVPTYYVDGKKTHEGVATKEIVRRVFETAIQE